LFQPQIPLRLLCYDLFSILNLAILSKKTPSTERGLLQKYEQSQISKSDGRKV